MEPVSSLVSQLLHTAGGNQGVAARALAVAVRELAHPDLSPRLILQSDISRWADGTRVPGAMLDIALRQAIPRAKKKVKELAPTP